MTDFSVTRRGALAGLGGIAAAGFAGSSAFAQSKTFTIIGHDAHRSAATTGVGGNVIEAWEKANDTRVNWITLDVPGITDRVLREASLGSSAMDMGYIVYMTERTLSLMEPIEAYLKSDPIEGDLSDFPPSLVDQLKSGGTLRGLPIRITAMGIVYNEQLLQERGITTLPRTMEEFVEVLRKCTYTRPDGSKVTGLMFFGAQNLSDIYSNFARSFNGDYILADSKLVANEEGNIKSLELLAQLYKEGVFPPESFTATAQEVLNYMSQGRAVFTVTSAANVERLNNPATGNYAGKFKVLPEWPMAAAFAGKVPYSPLLQSWSIVMPKNIPAERKKVTWSFIKNLVSKDSITRQALNGNGPPRISTISDPRAAKIPYMEYFAKGLQHGRVHVPHIVNAVRINDLFVQASQAAILGREPVKKAMDDAVARAKPLV